MPRYPLHGGRFRDFEVFVTLSGYIPQYAQPPASVKLTGGCPSTERRHLSALPLQQSVTEPMAQ